MRGASAKRRAHHVISRNPATKNLNDRHGGRSYWGQDFSRKVFYLLFETGDICIDFTCRQFYNLFTLSIIEYHGVRPSRIRFSLDNCSDTT